MFAAAHSALIWGNDIVERCKGKVLETARLLHDPECIELVFVSGEVMRLADNGQSCCENRYITCDDDLTTFTGDKLHGLEVREMASASGDSFGNEHETACLIVQFASGAVITCTTHNEHNGYYGGFCLVCTDGAS